MAIDRMIQFYSTADQWGFQILLVLQLKLMVKHGQRQHYFQAQKFPSDSQYQEKIRKANTPMIAARMGRDRKYPLRKDWESVKDQVMYQALQAKFTQHDSLKALLLSTSDAKLIEHTANDNYWADGGDGKGKNKLGLLLMKLRNELLQS